MLFESGIAVPPDVYPGEAAPMFASRNPKRRRALVHVWRTKDCERLGARCPCRPAAPRGSSSTVTRWVWLLPLRQRPSRR